MNLTQSYEDKGGKKRSELRDSWFCAAQKVTVQARAVLANRLIEEGVAQNAEGVQITPLFQRLVNLPHAIWSIGRNLLSYLPMFLLWGSQ